MDYTFNGQTYKTSGPIFREYPNKLWPQKWYSSFLHVRILTFPLNRWIILRLYVGMVPGETNKTNQRQANLMAHQRNHSVIFG